LLQHATVEVQPGQLAVDEALGALSNRRSRFSRSLFFYFNYNSLLRFHENSIQSRIRPIEHHLTNKGCSQYVTRMTFHRPSTGHDGPLGNGVKVAGRSRVTQKFRGQRPRYGPSEAKAFAVEKFHRGTRRR